MTEIAKRQIASNSEILSFNVNRRQVKKEKSLNSLGSPQNPEVFSDETISHPILGSINEMNEVPITVSGGSSGIKYLTASDVGLSEQTAGTYQYELSISIVDGFVPTVKKLLKKLYRTSNDVSDYIALLDIPDNYDSERQVAKLSVREAKTDEMSKTYVDALSYFQNLKDIGTEYKRASSLIASRGATKESIGLFQKRLNSVISKAEALISKTDTGATPSGVANQPSNSSLPNSPTVEIKQSFNNTVSVECKDDKYIDYFPGKGKIGGGLNIFTSTEVKNSTPETIYLETPSTSLEMLESRGVTFSIVPVSETYAIDTSPQKLVSTKKYISEDSQTVGGLLQDDLSPIDLSEVSVGSLVSTDEINMAVSSIAPKLSSVSTFQAPVGNITKVMPKVIETSGIVSSKAGISTSMPKGITTEGVMSSGANTSMQGTMVLVATQTSEPPTCSADSPAPILKSPEWKPIEEVADAKGTVVLCKQDNGLDEVSNGYFIMEMK
jgi:hypothetical protein